MSFGGGGGGGGSIGTATDVLLNNPASNDYLGYVGSGTNKWENLTLAGRAALANNGGSEGLVALGSKSGSVTLSLSAGNVVSVTLTGTLTPTFPTFSTTGAYSFGFYVTQDGTGSRTITWPSNVKWAGGTAPTLSTTANALDILVFETIDKGTTWYGSLVGTNFS